MHFTLIFHTFVFMQVFNEINSRKLGDKEFNVLQGFFNNSLFIVVIILTIVVQCLMVEYGGQSMRTIPLSWEHHAICIGIGAFSLIWGLLVKQFLPSSPFNRIQMQEEPMNEEQERYAVTTTFRKSFRQSYKKSATNKTMDATAIN
jgi:P-type Ca2+ transporter type 2B